MQSMLMQSMLSPGGAKHGAGLLKRPLEALVDAHGARATDLKELVRWICPCWDLEVIDQAENMLRTTRASRHGISLRGASGGISATP